MLEFVKITVKYSVQSEKLHLATAVVTCPYRVHDHGQNVILHVHCLRADMLLIWLSGQPSTANPSSTIQTEPITYRHGH